MSEEELLKLSENGQLELFRELTVELASHGGRVGIDLVPFRGGRLQYFNEKGFLQRHEILMKLRTAVLICRKVASLDNS